MRESGGGPGRRRHETRLQRRRRRAQAELEGRGAGRLVRIVLVAAVGLALVLGLTRLPGGLAQMAFFEVDAVTLEGARFLTADQARTAAALPQGFSVWDDHEPVARRVETHPLVASARVRRRLPSTLVVEVRERVPVAFHATPSLLVVDREGVHLPLDPSALRLDLPLVDADSPSAVGQVAAEVARISEMEPGVAAVLSDARMSARGDVVLHLSDPDVVFLYRPPLSPVRLRRGLRVLGHAMERSPEGVPSAIDLRFEDQVVVRHGPLTALDPLFLDSNGH